MYKYSYSLEIILKFTDRPIYLADLTEEELQENIAELHNSHAVKHLIPHISDEKYNVIKYTIKTEYIIYYSVSKHFQGIELEGVN